MTSQPKSDVSLPIGVFDSGVGGLTVVSALTRHLPRESILYLGDTARLPYGTKSPDTVARYTQQNVGFLLQRGVKAVVVACNTASALGLEGLKASGIPVWGVVEPGAEAAVAATRGRIGVLGTESTIVSDAYGRAILRRNPELEVISQACPLFVPLVEEGWDDDPITLQIAERYLAPVIEKNIDTLVLGCTHYPALVDLLPQVVGAEMTLVDPAESVAQKIAYDLRARGHLAVEPGEHHFCVTDNGDRFRRIANKLLGANTSDFPLSLELVEV